MKKPRLAKLIIIVAIAILGYFQSKNKSYKKVVDDVMSKNSKTQQIGPYLKKVSTNHWISPAGLHYKGKDRKGLTRAEHVLRHAKDMPNRAGKHSVFTAQGDQVFKLIDKAYLKAQEQGRKPFKSGFNYALEIDMREKIGYLGGQVGNRKGRPPLKKIKIILRKNQQDVITAYPSK